MDKVNRVLFVFVFWLALCAQTSANIYPWDLIRDPNFKKAYIQTVNPKPQDNWLMKLSGPTVPVRTIRIGSKEYLFFKSCKPHFCNTDNIIVLYKKSSKLIYAKLLTKGEFKILGQPSKMIENKLNVLYEETFKTHN